MIYLIIAVASIAFVAVSIMAGIWLNERKLKRTRDIYRDVDVKEWL
jgi:ABC-type phosphate transport system permease subunit